MDKHREQRLMELLQAPSPDEMTAEGIDDEIEEAPLDPKLKQRLIDAVQALPASVPAAPQTAAPQTAAPQTAAPIVSLAWYRSRKSVVVVAGALAAAACAMLMVRSIYLPPVGAAEMKLQSVQTNLGGPPQAPAPTAPVHYPRTALLKLDLASADTTNEEELVVDSYIRRPGGPIAPWIRPERVHDNHFELRYRIDELPKLQEGGEWELVMILGRPGHMPTAEEVQAALADGRAGSRHWSIHHRPVVIEAP